MKPLTVILPCFNEAHNMRDLLESVKWADEVLVVDSFSTDETIEIAKTYTDRILQRTYQNSANQKNWAIPQAANEWVLVVDADERVTPALKTEIVALLSGEPEHTAYWIGRENYFLGKRVNYSGWQNDRVIRLFKRDHCRYEEKNVHAEIETQGSVGMLSEKLVHQTYKSSQHFLAKMERYAAWSAEDYALKTPKVTLFHLWLKPLARFIKHYFIRLGFLDGRVGFIVSSIMAWGVFLRYVKIKEQRMAPKGKDLSPKK